MALTRPRRTAICRGAVFKGFLSGSGDVAHDNNIRSPIKVASTISRASFGNIYRTLWDDGNYLEEDKVWDSDEEVWRADNQMDWYIKRVRLTTRTQTHPDTPA